MSKLSAPLLFFLVTHSFAKASISLYATPNATESIISLRWNMVDYPTGTAYVLLKSKDGVVWQLPQQIICIVTTHLRQF